MPSSVCRMLFFLKASEVCLVPPDSTRVMTAREKNNSTVGAVFRETQVVGYTISMRELFYAMQCLAAYTHWMDPVTSDITHHKDVEMVLSFFGSDRRLIVPRNTRIMQAIYRSIGSEGHSPVMHVHYLPESNLIVADLGARLATTVLAAARCIAIQSTTQKGDTVAVDAVELFYRRFPITRFETSQAYGLVHNMTWIGLEAGSQMPVSLWLQHGRRVEQRVWHSRHLCYDPDFDLCTELPMPLTISIIGTCEPFYMFLDAVDRQHRASPINKWDAGRTRINTTLRAYEPLYERVQLEIKTVLDICGLGLAYDGQEDGSWGIEDISITGILAVVVSIKTMCLRKPCYTSADAVSDDNEASLS